MKLPFDLGHELIACQVAGLRIAGCFVRLSGLDAKQPGVVEL